MEFCLYFEKNMLQSSFQKSSVHILSSSILSYFEDDVAMFFQVPVPSALKNGFFPLVGIIDNYFYYFLSPLGHEIVRKPSEKLCFYLNEVSKCYLHCVCCASFVAFLPVAQLFFHENIASVLLFFHLPPSVQRVL